MTAWRKFKRNLAAGTLVIAPVVVTVFLLFKSFLFLDGLLSAAVNAVIRFIIPIPFLAEHRIPGVGFVALIILLWVTGFAVRNVFGQLLFVRIQRTIDQIPLVNRIYKATRQISEALLYGRQEIFQKAVMIEYPRKGLYCIAIMTAQTGGKVSGQLPDGTISVFLPTTPNPTSGFLLFVPRDEVVFLDISVEEALKLIISGGTISALEERRQPISQ